MKSTSLQRAAGIAAVGLAALWSGYALLADAPAVDEAPHLAAGISYLQLGDYRFNPEHPPLIKLAAGAAVSLISPALPTGASWWENGINEQWRAGYEVIWGGANDPAAAVALGRLGVTLLNFALLVTGWRYVARRYGEPWGLAFAILIAASPFFLGHAHLITTDVTAAATGLLACFAFASFLERPHWRSGGIAAAAFGIAQLAKFSMVLLVPAFAIVAVIVALQSHGRNWKLVWRALVRTGAVALAGFALVVYPAYAALTANATAEQSERDAAFLLSSFAGGPALGPVCNPMRCVAELTVWGTRHEVTRPAATYALGVLMVMQRSAGGNTVYFAGDVGSSGSRLYFPYVYLGKETLPALAVVLIGLLALFAQKRGQWNEVGKSVTPELVMGTFAALYLLMTVRSSLNIGVRHLFPVVPIAYLFALGGWRAITARAPRARHVLVALLALHVLAGVLSLPHPLASYNSLAGGTRGGYRIAADSNYDWGQDALRLREWVDAHPKAGRVAVDLYGASDTEKLIGERAVPWTSERGNPAAYGIRWIAVSVNTLLNASGTPVPGEPRLVEDEYRWLKAMRGVAPGEVPEPDARAGASVFLYELE